MVRSDGLHRLALGPIANVAVMLQHGAIQMTANAHDGLIAGFTLGELGNPCGVDRGSAGR